MSTTIASRQSLKTRLSGLPAAGSWAVLMILTLLSWWLGDGHGPGQIATIVVLVVAFLKVAVVGENFMELKHAPPALRLAFHGWSVVVCIALIVLYLVV